MKLVQENKFVVLQPQGELTATAGMSLKGQVSAIEADQVNLCILDLSQVDFIDSAGLLELVGVLNVANQKQCRLVICNPHPSVRLIFEITQLDAVFEIFNTYSEATGELVKESDSTSWADPDPIAA